MNPGTFTIELGYYHKGVLTSLVSPTSFTVKALDNTVMPAEDRSSKVAFQRKVSILQGEIQLVNRLTPYCVWHLRRAEGAPGKIKGFQLFLKAIS